MARYTHNSQFPPRITCLQSNINAFHIYETHFDTSRDVARSVLSFFGNIISPETVFNFFFSLLHFLFYFRKSKRCLGVSTQQRVSCAERERERHKFVCLIVKIVHGNSTLINLTAPSVFLLVPFVLYTPAGYLHRKRSRFRNTFSGEER
jgi:hypothetical protein